MKLKFIQKIGNSKAADVDGRLKHELRDHESEPVLDADNTWMGDRTLRYSRGVGSTSQRLSPCLTSRRG